MTADRTKSPIELIFSKDIVLFLLLGIAGLTFSIWRFADAFPAASISLKVSPGQAVAIAKQFARASGFELEDVSTFRTFDLDDEAATFLEYQLGVAKANELMRDTIPVFRWEVTIHNLDEDFTADIGTDGKLQAFHREVLPAFKHNKAYHAVGTTTVSNESARTLASRFAIRNLDVQLEKWKLVGEVHKDLPGPLKHQFTWEDETREFAGARLRINAEVAGDRVTGLRYFLHVPDSFTEKFHWLRAQNEALSTADFMFIFPALISLPFVFLWGWANREIRIPLAIGFGAAGAFVGLLTSLNKTLSVVASTTDWHMGSYQSAHLLTAACVAILSGVGCTIMFAGIEVVYRSAFPKQVALENLFNGRALNTVSFAKNTLLGAAIFGMSTGYQVLFYLVGKKFGLWIPLQISDHSVIGSFCPTWDGVSLGLLASTTEEMGFRVFLLIVLQRITRSFWLANLLQAALWGFGHCSYAVEPPYARGIELTVVGLFSGWIMRRYGVVPLLISHYAFDAYLTVLPLLGSELIYDRIFGALAMLPLLALPAAAFACIRHRGLVSDESLANQTIEIIKPVLPQEEAVRLPAFEPLSSRLVRILALALAISIALSLIPGRYIGNSASLRIDKMTAIANATAYFAKNKFDLSSRQATAWLSDETDEEEMQYLYEQMGYASTRRVEKNVEPRLVWNVRIFKVGDPTILSAKLAPDGKVVSATISLDETAEGTNLAEDKAKQMAESYFKQTPVGSNNEFKISDISKTEHASRTDYTFGAEVPNLRVSNARFMMYVDLVGEHFSNFACRWSVPEKFKGKSSRKHEKDLIVTIAWAIVAGLLLLNLGHWILQTLRQNPPNKPVLNISIVLIAIMSAAETINLELSEAFRDYVPIEPMNTYMVSIAWHCVGKLAMDLFTLGFIVALATSCYRQFLPRSLSSILKTVQPLLNNKRAWSDTILLGFTTAAAIIAILHTSNSLFALVSPEIPLVHFNRFCQLEQFSPALATILDASKHALFLSLVAAAAIRWNNFYKADPAHLVGLALLILFLSFGYDSGAEQYLVDVISHVACAAIAYLLIVKIGKLNIPALFVAVIVYFVALDLKQLVAHALVIQQLDVAVLSCILAIPLLWLSCLGLADLQRRMAK